MKIVLLKDVPKIGNRNDIKEVSDGYALNFLIPRGLAEAATAKAAERASVHRQREEAEKKIKEDLLLKNLKDIASVKIEISEKANEKGHLFAGIHKDRVMEELKKQARVELNAEYVLLPEPIKEVGEHEVEVRVQDKTAKFKVSVIAG